MMSRTYFLEGQTGRFASASRQRASALSRRGQQTGWLIIALLTLLYGGWLAYRWLFQPAWPESLPSLLAELLRLFELAAAFTLVLLWIGLLWRRKAGQTQVSNTALTVEQMYGLSPKAFEHYVADLFRRKGYRVAVRGRSGDHGVDLELASSDGRRAVVQCKRYKDTVGEEVVRGLFGTMLHEGVHHAFLVTTAEISDAARAWAAGKPITLIDGLTLVEVAQAIDGSQDR
ncbi:MAG: restriction endonuclease [Chloroflexota bacterium]|nr:MAG: restriction endonuclease [Chloroflexota bacterium]